MASLISTSVSTTSAGPTRSSIVFKPEKGLSAASSIRSRGGRASRSGCASIRLRSLRTFERKPMAPWFAVNMPDIDFQDIYYYLKPTDAIRSTSGTTCPSR